MSIQSKLKAVEMNFDGIVGPTHHYAGLSYGNVASMKNKASVSNPKEAALQGLKKMKALQKLGLSQGVLPPHERPHLATLRSLGFTGKDSEMIEKASKDSVLFASVCSSSFMWTANAATVCPSFDSHDQKVHFTPANLVSNFHRSIEPDFTSQVLKRVFSDSTYFHHHSALPKAPAMGDEGAANHTRLCGEDYASSGIHFFVYGKKAFNSLIEIAPQKFPARQTYEASCSLARLPGLSSNQVIFALQNPEMVDQGVFHNDVAAVGNQNVYFYHEKAYHDTDRVFGELNQKFKKVSETPLNLIQVQESELSLNEAVKSYLFNSQLITLSSGKMALILPTECQDSRVQTVLGRVISEDNPISEAHYFDLKQSMRNGGGPACLRLRVVLSEVEKNAVHSGVVLDDSDDLFSKLTTWIERNYRDRLSFEDLADPKFFEECQRTLDELTQVLGLGSLYSFQKI